MADITLGIILRGDSSGLRGEVKISQAELQKLGKTAADVGAQGARGMSGFGTALGSVTRLLGTFGVAVGAAAIVRFGINALNAAGGLGELAEQLGVTTDNLQVYQFAAAQAGVSTGELESSLAIFSRTIGDAAKGNKTAIDSFNALGVGVLDAQGKLRSTDDVLRDVAEAIARIEDPALRAAAAQDVFGRGGQRLLPILSGGAGGLERLSAEAKRLGLVLDEDAIDAADRAGDELAKFQLRIDRLAQRVAAALAGPFNDFVDWMERVGAAETEGIATFQRMKEMRDLADEIAATRERLAEFDRADEGGFFEPGVFDADKAALEQQLAELLVRQRQLAGGNGPQTRPRLGGSGEGSFNPPPSGDGGGEDPAKKLAEYIEGLRFEAEQLQRTARDQAIYNAVHQAGVDINSDAGRTIAELVASVYDYGQRQDELNKQLDEENELHEEGRQLIESLRTPFEQYLADLARAEELLNAGAIGQDAFNRAIDDAGDRYAEAKGLLDEAAESASFFAEISDEASDVIGTSFENAALNVRDWNSALDVGIGLLTDVERIILRLAVTKPLEDAVGGLLEGIDFGSIFGSIFGPSGPGPGAGPEIRHGGGIAGRGGLTRRVPSGAFDGAPRMHGGGWVGEGEVPTILRRGEGVFTPEQMAAMGGGGVKVEVINNTGQQARTQQRRGDDGRQLIQVIIGEVASDVASGGQVGRAIAHRFGTGFAPGTLRS